MPTTGDLYSREEAAAYLGVAVSTLANWACTGVGGPPMVKLGTRKVAYRKKDLDKWLDKRTVSSSSEASEL